MGGEDPAAYDEFLARLSADVKPRDVIEQILVRDALDQTWEILRMRRLKAGLLTSAMLNQLLGKFEPAELMHQWAVRDPDAIEDVNRLLALEGLNVENVAVVALSAEIESFERIDRLIMNAEARRNAALRELERHRTTLAQDLRQASDDVVEADFEDVAPVRRRLKDKS
jgi:hypothetical protein